jgi:nucleotide-binding universal stress UspA family protein
MNDDLGPWDVPADTIVVGLDATDAWQATVDWAAEEAVLEGRDITLVHAADATEELWHDTGGRDVRIGVKESPTVPELLLDRARARVGRRAPGVTVHGVLRGGNVRQVLHGAAQDAHLLVVGSRRHRTTWSRLFGTHGSAVARRPPCPVVVVHAGHPGLVHRGVLVGVDDSEHSQQALQFALRQGSLRQLPVTVLHVAPEPVAAGSSLEVVEEQLHLAEAMAGVRETYPDVHIETMLAQGEPAAALLRAGRRMNLIVVGAHHGRTVSDVLLGSVVAPVVERAACPVAVVPDSPHPDPARRTP